MKPLLSMAFSALLALAHQTPAAGWRGLAPLRSTRADVERLLGRPESESGSVYVTDGERVSVTYSRRPCDYGWQVSPDTVISFFVHPKQPPALADLKLDEKKYERRRDLHIEHVYYYIDREAGINYTFDSVKGLVTGVEYYPPLKSKARRCQPSSSALPGDADATAEPAAKPAVKRPAKARGRRQRARP
jgi:hypothetical protein